MKTVSLASCCRDHAVLTHCTGNVKDQMQNLMMGHASIKTFLKHYLSRRITVDVQAVVRGMQPRDALMRAACTMSRSVDRRRPRQLTAEQSASVNEHPAVRSLIAQRERLRRARKDAVKHSQYKALGRKINRERQRQRHALLQDVKERWEYEQSVRDVEQQLAGIEPKDKFEEVHDVLPSAQQELVDAMLAKPGLSLEEELRRRNKAIRAVTRYCGIEEGVMNPIRRKRQSGKDVPPGKSQPERDREVLEAAKVSVYKEKRPKRCFKCVGNPNLPIQERVYEFGREGDVSRHFKRKHLQYIREGVRPSCELCKISLQDKMHFQRHALDVHGIVT